MMMLFKAQYGFKDLHQTSNVLTETRVNQWRLRKILPAEKEGRKRGSGFPAQFSLWSLVFAEGLAELSNYPAIDLATAGEILKSIGAALKSNYKQLENSTSLEVTVDVGVANYRVLSLIVDGVEVKCWTGNRSGLELKIDIGRLIRDKKMMIKEYEDSQFLI